VAGCVVSGGGEVSMTGGSSCLAQPLNKTNSGNSMIIFFISFSPLSLCCQCSGSALHVKSENSMHPRSCRHPDCKYLAFQSFRSIIPRLISA
jgi:hypothetical protein